jgi:hypothetical protein
MNRALRRDTLSTEQSNLAAISMSCTPSAAYKIILARCTVRNGNVTVPARRSSTTRSSAESSTTYVLVLGTTHNSARPALSLPILRRMERRHPSRQFRRGRSRGRSSRPAPAAANVPASPRDWSARAASSGGYDRPRTLARRGRVVYRADRRHRRVRRSLAYRGVALAFEEI